MKRIRKSHPEPKELADYRDRFANTLSPPGWVGFKTAPSRREPVKNRLRDDQRGLCAYCENSLIPEDESVEHFVARHADHSLELAWSNLLLCCSGGERPVPENVSDATNRYETGALKTCGHAKLRTQMPILNPIDLPAFPRLFRCSSENGDFLPDDGGCRAAGLDADLAERTLNVLNLRAGRLMRARHALLDELLRLLANDGAESAFSPERAREIAVELIPASGPLPAFFTTIRWFLGVGAEEHLRSVSFQG